MSLTLQSVYIQTRHLIVPIERIEYTYIYVCILIYLPYKRFSTYGKMFKEKIPLVHMRISVDIIFKQNPPAFSFLNADQHNVCIAASIPVSYTYVCICMNVTRLKIIHYTLYIEPVYKKILVHICALNAYAYVLYDAKETLSWA